MAGVCQSDEMWFPT